MIMPQIDITEPKIYNILYEHVCSLNFTITPSNLREVSWSKLSVGPTTFPDRYVLVASGNPFEISFFFRMWNVNPLNKSQNK